MIVTVIWKTEVNGALMNRILKVTKVLPFDLQGGLIPTHQTTLELQNQSIINGLYPS